MLMGAYTCALRMEADGPLTTGRCTHKTPPSGVGLGAGVRSGNPHWSRCFQSSQHHRAHPASHRHGSQLSRLVLRMCFHLRTSAADASAVASDATRASGQLRQRQQQQQERLEKRRSVMTRMTPLTWNRCRRRVLLARAIKRPRAPRWQECYETMHDMCVIVRGVRGAIEGSARTVIFWHEHASPKMRRALVAP